MGSRPVASFLTGGQHSVDNGVGCGPAAAVRRCKWELTVELTDVQL
ncbi:hypothetical protein DPX39_010038000 [Trypanosoma brucei equiperdum]|uniref:Uncharacterized protein n=1 Tax=Trypanosoma brucei equiperdum TaxID=630700 RepID=A0A3L6LFL8_9TRYP|nr:hypothetical protein DPX39_010038000 [Trypanosoma brucei equiperdum]